MTFDPEVDSIGLTLKKYESRTNIGLERTRNADSGTDRRGGQEA
jgi:hypothetical protein